MAKTRNAKILPSSEQIIEHLNKGKSVGQLVKMGFAESTVKYYRRKLFNPESYERFVSKIAQYNKSKATS